MKKYTLHAVIIFSLFAFYSNTMYSQIFESGNLPSQLHSGGVTGVWDMNNDGLNDIVVMDQSTTLKILYQQADGTFVESNIGTSFGTQQWGMTVADIDNDGWGDVMCGGHYDGVHFFDIDEIGNAITATDFSANIFMQACTFGDLDNDGWLDAFACHDDGPAFMFKNNGTGQLIGDQTMIDYNIYPGFYPGSSDPLMSGNYGNEFCDFDRDGDMDLMVAKCRQVSNDPLDVRRTNLLFVNDGNNHYADDAHARGLVNLQQSWTATFGDIDNDGDFDCFMTTHSGGIRMYENNGLGYFTDISASAGLTTPGFFMQGQMADFDNDGYLDVLHAGGTFGYYHNNGDKTFTEMNAVFNNPQTMHGFALGDLNNDGFVDVYANYGNPSGYVSPSNIPDILWLSQPNQNHWIGFDLEGTISNKNAVGALVEIHGSFGTQIREVRSGVSYGITNSNLLVFGLGNTDAVDYAIIYWPAGGMQVVTNPTIDQYNSYVENECLILPTSIVNSNDVIQLCPGQSVTLTAFSDDPTAQILWNTGATSNDININYTGTFYALAYDSVGCASTSQKITVEVSVAVPPSIISLGDLVYCASAPDSLTTETANQYLWSNGDTNQTIAPIESGYYSLQVDRGCGWMASLDSLELIVMESPSLSADNVQMSSPGAATLTAISNGNVQWMDSNNVLIGNGNSITVDLSTTSNFWVQSQLSYPGAQVTGGAIAPDLVNGAYSNSTFHLIFDAHQDLIIDSVLVNAQSPGIRQIELVDALGAQLLVGSFDLPMGMSYIPLNFFVPQGSNYGLRPVTGSQPSLWRDGNGTQLNYPYEIGNLATITGTTVAIPNNYSLYYFFYDWHVSSPDYVCSTAWLPLQVEITSNVEESLFSKWSGEGCAIFPNPGVNNVYIEMPLNQNQDCRVEVYSSDGRILFKGNKWQFAQSTKFINVPTQNWPSGMYSIRIWNGQKFTSKIWIKE